jgi:lipopolysaccharide transport system ATP-binding protein
LKKESIIVENLSKEYQLGTTGLSSFRDSFSNLFSKNEHKANSFWALKDISFTIEQGEAVGIIGRNGAGKSTLLKILSRITYPTKGRFQLNGRVSSLLEVGTGFHPELTGRENIYLNGTILGMTRSEVKSKFDEIVAFSGVEQFIDTPVKRYSSGMYVRLAFAVAAHLEPEILIVDEVLAVGDAEFQKKCLGKMKDVSSNQGRTVLFVSHNMGAINQLCSKGVLLQNGGLLSYDKINIVTKNYLSCKNNLIILDRRNTKEYENKIHFTKFEMLDFNNVSKNDFLHDEDIYLKVEIFVPTIKPTYEFALSLYDSLKNRVFTIHENFICFKKLKENIIELKIKISSHFITPGSYSWIMCINEPGIEIHDLNDDFNPFNIIDNGSDFYKYKDGTYGPVFAKYTIEKL